MKAVPHTIKGKTIDPKRAKARPGIKKIFVGGLDIDYPEADIRAYFEKYGKVSTFRFYEELDIGKYCMLGGEFHI